MHLYRASAKTMRDDLADDLLVRRLGQAYLDQLLHPPSQSEVRSWERSLEALASVLIDAGLEAVEVLLEYQLPLSSKRIDALLVGQHPNGGPSTVVVENKQWTVGEIEDVEERSVFVAGRRLLHPQQQVAQYVKYLADYNTLASSGGLQLAGLAFLHNATAALYIGKEGNLLDRRAEGAGVAGEVQAVYEDPEDFRRYVIPRLRDLSRPEIARAAGITDRSLRSILEGRHHPRPSVRRRLEEAVKHHDQSAAPQ